MAQKWLNDCVKSLSLYMKYKKITLLLLGVAIILALVYLAVFGRALGQKENHLGIILALPKVFFSSSVARIDDKTYLAKNNDSFIETMKQQGFTHVEQLGSGNFFEKDGESYISISRMYSSFFMIFTYPELVTEPYL